MAASSSPPAGPAALAAASSSSSATPAAAVAAAAAAAAAISPGSSLSLTPASSGLLDLEKELSCSICTDTLYQPLTLLDCLHTFCGSCLKLWFAWQATQVDDDPDIDEDDERLANPYTCPSCRAHVRGTRPDAKITTLLDMYLAANPGKGKSEEEKAEMREKYSPGDDVVPRLKESAEDRRMVREVRQMNIRDAERARRAQRAGAGYQRGIRHEAGRRSDGGTDDGNEGTQHLGHQSSLRSLASMDTAELEADLMRQILEEGLLDGIDWTNMNSRTDELAEYVAEAYRRRHGSRLRLRRRDSSEDRRRDTSRRRDGSRRREASGSRDRSSRRERSASGQLSPPQSARSPPRSPGRSPAQSAGRAHSRSTSEVQGSSRPEARVPIQRDDLLQAYPVDNRQRRRSSDGRRQTSPAAPGPLRATSDLGVRPSSSEQQQQPQQPRRANRTASGSEIPSHRQILRDSPTNRSPLQGSPVQSPPQSPPATGRASSRTNSLTAGSMAPSVTPVEHMANPHPTLASSASYHPNTQITAPSRHDRANSLANSIPGISRLQGQGFPEPVIKCERCGKTNIQYELHYNCASCKNGKYNICHRCYKTGQGCLVWYGFGHTAWRKYQAKGAPSPELPHVLIGARYRRPDREDLVEGSSTSSGKLIAKEPAQKRRRVGAFCYTCHEYAEDFFYKCDTCNEGEWGFCKRCVNTGRCCTHPLLPLAWVSSNRFRSSSSDIARGVQASFAPINDQSMIQPFPPSTTGQPRQYRPLTVSTTCDRCRVNIQPTMVRYHCPVCNEGTAEWCPSCYSRLQEEGVIKPQDGANGWRRCPRGHRTVLLAFKDGQLGQQRVILRDLVGGHFLLDTSSDGSTLANPTAVNRNGGGHSSGGGGADANALEPPRPDERRYKWNEGDLGRTTTLSRPQAGGAHNGGSSNDSRLNVPGSPPHSSSSHASSSSPLSPASAGNTTRARFPPDGGVGKRCCARWSWIPRDGVEDELMFPRGAEITEVLDVTDEWCEGSYAGAKGVFPASYVRVNEMVTM